MLSEDEIYRYELRREWDAKLRPFIAIMLNPSKADATRNDPTITRLIRRAAHAGFGSLIVINIGAYRATNPKDWLKAADPYGPGNRRAIRRVLHEARMRKGLVLAGWGGLAPQAAVEDVIRIAKRIGVKLRCLGITNGGQPLHPLRVGYSEPIRYYIQPMEVATWTESVSQPLSG